jgi:hypothetical protein
MSFLQLARVVIRIKKEAKEKLKGQYLDKHGIKFQIMLLEE